MMKEEFMQNMSVKNQECFECEAGQIAAADEEFWRYYLDAPYSSYEWNDGLFVETSQGEEQEHLVC